MNDPVETQTFGPLVYGATKNWYDLLLDLTKSGQFVTVRGRNIKEILFRKAVIDMNEPVVMSKERKLGLGFMFAEAAWILSGRNDVRSIAPFAKKIREFSDDGYFFQGAYGPQIIQQLPYILECFKKDLYTRQAVISIWKPSPPNSKDIPCTITVQFMVRANCLHTFVSMRSSDAWLGIPYDWFNFSMLSYYVMALIGNHSLLPGFLHFVAASQHCYEDDASKVVDVLQNMNPIDDAEGFSNMIKTHLIEVGNPQQIINNLWDMAYSELDK